MNLKELKEMINLMNENGLTELEIEKDNVKIKLRKQPTGAVTHEVVRQTPLPSASSAAISIMQPGAQSSSPPAVAMDEFIVRSPMVGTFYAAPGPESEPFVSIGKVVKEDDVLCILEAMKLMNEIKAEVAGTITAILVKNGQAVEYDQPLFHLKKS
ncbi:MAG: acetyl-CoA carboxylase biotin carboxyl carrier protein [Candidatus Omnitrophica bacterium]|nr:acetyl-CoA carboxylase biotin carboxyl carrier protein [Candidatus Omnitrophota bacterium]